MNVFRITCDNGDIVTTGFNGTLDDARRYYLGNIFNLGTYHDDLHRCTAVEQLPSMESTLAVLDAMDEFRRTHQDGRYPAGWCMKAITAIAARAAGCVSVLALAEMEEFCRTHQDIRLHPADWCMRVLEAIVARAAGYGDRNSWTEVLKADTSSLYHRDLQNPVKSGF